MAKISSKGREKLSESTFAFPRERKEPLTDARHVQDALARFDQVEGVSNAERDEAWKRIKKAAKEFSVEIQEQNWHELFTRNGQAVPKD